MVGAMEKIMHLPRLLNLSDGNIASLARSLAASAGTNIIQTAVVFVH